MAKGDKTSMDITFQEEFTKFPRYSIWNEGLVSASVGQKRVSNQITHKVWLFWANYTHLNNLLLIRRQTFGLCYMHAPVTLQHYLVTMATNGEKSKMMDIGRYEADRLYGESLRIFLTDVIKGNSKKILEKICQLNDIDDIDSYEAPDPSKKRFESRMQELIEFVNKGQPALVSNFRIYEDIFENKANAILCGKPTGKLNERTHSMVLIGIRKEVSLNENREEESKYYYLLQNWWQSQYFVEVDALYMFHCEPKITFVLKSLTEYTYDKNQLNEVHLYVDFSPYAETCFEMEEELMFEG